MSGIVIPVTPKRLVDFVGLAIGSTQDFVLADRVPVPDWRELTLRVNVHQHSLSAATGTITIMAAPQSWTREDPGILFLTTPSTGWTQIAISTATPTPAYLATNVILTGGNCMGAMTRIIARGNRVAAGALNGLFSIGFSAKDS